jgi:hypothetical protein
MDTIEVNAGEQEPQLGVEFHVAGETMETNVVVIDRHAMARTNYY